MSSIFYHNRKFTKKVKEWKKIHLVNSNKTVVTAFLKKT